MSRHLAKLVQLAGECADDAKLRFAGITVRHHAAFRFHGGGRQSVRDPFATASRTPTRKGARFNKAALLKVFEFGQDGRGRAERWVHFVFCHDFGASRVGAGHAATTHRGPSSTAFLQKSFQQSKQKACPQGMCIVLSVSSKQIRHVCISFGVLPDASAAGISCPQR